MRLAGQIKMGYYPTPPVVTQAIKEHLNFVHYGTLEANSNLLDPCCGEGDALARIAEGEKAATTYGIELDGARAQEAKKRLKHVVHAGYEQVEIPPETMSLLYLNPPYDEEEGIRKEYIFLKDLLHVLAPRGILVYIIPQVRLSRSIAEMLASNFVQVRSYRFPDPEFEKFSQIVILGEKTSWPRENKEGALELLQASEATLPVLPDHPAYTARYMLPPTSKATLSVREFSPADLVRMAASSPLRNRIRDLWEPATLDRIDRPPIPLHRGHLGLLLAAGRLNGLVGEGALRHIVAGKPEKKIVESHEEEEDKEGNPVEVERRLETFQVSIKILLPSGEIRKLT